MRPIHVCLTALAASLTVGAAAPEDLPARAEAGLLATRFERGLDEGHGFALRGLHADELGQTHVRFQQTYRGVKVWGGEAIAHLGPRGEQLSITDALRPHIFLNPHPALSASEALAVAHQDLAPTGPYAHPPQTELVIHPLTAIRVKGGLGRLNALDVETSLVDYELAYHVHLDVAEAGDTRQRDYLIHAHTGAILKAWDSLHTAAAFGTGKSEYSGTVTLNTSTTATGYELRDTTRGNGGTYGANVVTTMANGTSGNGALVTDADNTWGDGQNYVVGGGADNAQTAAVDAGYGAQITWDYYLKVHGRNGIDGNGTATYTRVHYDKAYDNAFWDDQCFCMTYGDGSTFKVLTAIDVAGHEMSHGVCSKTAGLVYQGESGGLNEANSDINGTMVEFYARGGSGSTIGSTGGTWTIGEQLSTPAFPRPLRYMMKPSLDGRSPDAWSPTLSTLDVHLSSGPMNRCFYFLSQGASSNPGSQAYSSYLPGGMAGIGNDKAARIWYRTLTVYLTQLSQYRDARSGAISAATDLYGAASAEVAAVKNAFAAINVGGSVLGL